MENKENETFTFTYSAKEQEEIKNIRKKYAAPEENKMELLRRLDAGVTKKGTTAALIVGVLGTLLLGIGMCCCMVWQGAWFLPGVIIGVIGIAVLSAAYPLYNHVTRKERKKIAPEILRLTDELMK
ncbi:MAG: hypothetical protein J6I98_06080 [Clostridia bacterium]|nr:hypothetical protein [Clostridia bacterium]